MKRLFSIILCSLLIFMLCSCDNTADTADNTTSETTATATGDEVYSSLSIVGTWVCEDISDECYFIFEENGDAFAKWGTSTVYGYFDYYEEEDIYDIDVPNFLFNEYKAKFSGDKMTLKSDDSSYSFEKATMPKVTIKAPDNLAVDDKIIGNWQSADSYECYEFRGDSSGVITDMMNYSTVDFKYSCDKGVVTFYYMSSDTKDGSREVEYSFNEHGKLVMGGYTYENVTGQ